MCKSLDFSGPLAQQYMRWTTADIAFEIIDGLSDDPVVAVVITTPIGELKMMAEVELAGTLMKLRGMHVQGAAPNQVGRENLVVLAQTVMERMGYDGLEIEGAIRTTGANPGRRPHSLRFKRHLCPAAATGP